MRGSNAVGCSIGSAATTKHGATWSRASGCWPREAGGLTYNAQAVETFFARLKRFFVAREHRAAAARAAARRCAAADFHRGLSALGHDADRAGAREPLRGARRRRAVVRHASCGSSRCSSSPDPSRSRRTWRAPGQRTTAGPPRCSATTTSRAPSSTGCSRPASATSPTRCRSTRSGCRCVRMAFPHAKIVRVLRHPLDVCVSMLANNMTHGFNCGYRIEDIVHHLLAVSDLDEHYARELGCRRARSCTTSASSRSNAARPRRLLDHLGLRARAGVPELPRESALRADAELCAGDAAAQRPFHRTPPALCRAARAVPIAAAAAGRSAGVLTTARARVFALRTSAARRRSTRGRCRRSRAAAARCPRTARSSRWSG